ncbi:MAG: acyltransferase [Rhizonema sp. PD37]|nr:acyltransferase [Rhizonema sp. PD37]
MNTINDSSFPMEVPESSKSGEQRLRLHYLDGLRGLVSLYVVIYHIDIDEYIGEDNIIGKIFDYGDFAVAIFIVLSGYVLMLPVTRSQSGYLSEGLWNYIQRRARRILPPYYAALIFSILVAAIILGLIKIFNFQWHKLAEDEIFKPFFSPIDLITHLLLIQNFTSDTVESIDAPMWSIAVEWQIYFIFPLLLLPIWRRFGLFSTVIATFLISSIPFYLWNTLIGPVHTWFIGLFALGMTAADIGFSQKPKLLAIRKSFPWSLFAIIFFIIALITNKQILETWIYDYICGLTAACVLIYCTKCVNEGKKSLILQLFEAPWAIALGAFSYSLYLTHAVIITVLGHFLLNFQMSPVKFISILCVVALPLSLVIAYLFYLIFEKPFLSNFLKKRKVKDAVN